MEQFRACTVAHGFRASPPDTSVGTQRAVDRRSSYGYSTLDESKKRGDAKTPFYLRWVLLPNSFLKSGGYLCLDR